MDICMSGMEDECGNEMDLYVYLSYFDHMRSVCMHLFFYGCIMTASKFCVSLLFISFFKHIWTTTKLMVGLCKNDGDGDHDDDYSNKS